MKSSDVLTLLVIGAPYLLALSVLYLLGYWSTYDVNIFHFVKMDDLIRLSMSQLGYYGVFLVFGMVIGRAYLEPVLPPGSGYNDPEAVFVRRHWRWFFLLPVGAFIYFSWFSDHPSRWIAIAMIFGPISGLALSRTEFLRDSVQNEAFRFFALFWIGFAPFLSFIYGTLDAHIVRNPNGQTLISFNESSDESFLYLGKYGSYFFIYHPANNQVEAIRSDTIQSFRIFKSDAPREEADAS